MAHWLHGGSKVGWTRNPPRDNVQGLTHHILIRLIFGIYGSYIGIIVRIFLSVIWYGSQAWLGGLCVSVMLSSWSYSFLTMKNTLPASAHMETRDLVGFLLFHLISAPLLVRIPPRSIPPRARG